MLSETVAAYHNSLCAHLQLLQQRQLLCSTVCCCFVIFPSMQTQQRQPITALQQQLVLCLQPGMLCLQLLG
jgi:hypothetical protein